MTQVSTQVSTQALDAALRERGLRATPQRRSVLRAVSELGHATPEEVCEFVQTRAVPTDAPTVNLSTVYRALELMEKIGVVSHTHLTHGSPTYQVATHANHLHLVCRGCGRITEADLDLARPLAARVLAGSGFRTDLAHLSLHGLCVACSEGDQTPTEDVGGHVGADTSPPLPHPPHPLPHHPHSASGSRGPGPFSA